VLRSVVCAARPPFDPGSRRARPTRRGAGARRSQVHCRKIGRAQHAAAICTVGNARHGSEGLSLSGGASGVFLALLQAEHHLGAIWFRATKRATRWVALADFRWLCALTASAWPPGRGRGRAGDRRRCRRRRAGGAPCGSCRTARRTRRVPRRGAGGMSRGGIA
jgi:hypothetical protein